uniref:Uncharacterized protein n=1 Tax=Arundo donax TaxID=35708 RepID=A0A0A8ZB54_ARUDO
MVRGSKIDFFQIKIVAVTIESNVDEHHFFTE